VARTTTPMETASPVGQIGDDGRHLQDLHDRFMPAGGVVENDGGVPRFLEKCMFCHVKYLLHGHFLPWIDRYTK